MVGCLFLLLVALCGEATLFAAESLTLSQAIDLAQTGNPRVEADVARRQSAEALREQAGYRLNPRLIFQTENTRFWQSPRFRFSDGADNFAYLSQVFETAGKRGLRTSLADANAQVAEQQIALTRARIVARVRVAYWTAAGAHAVADLYRQQLMTFGQIVEYNRNRVREGILAEVDLIRVEVEAKRLEVAARGAEADAQRAIGQLNLAMGIAPRDWQLTDALEGAVRDPERAVEEAVRNRAELRLGESSVRAAESNVRLQRALAKPDVEILFGYKRTSGFNTLLGGAQVNLPIFNRNVGQIKSAEAIVREQTSQVAATEAQIRAEIDSYLTEYRTRRDVVTRTIGPMLQQAEQTARLANGAYREGGADLLRLLDAERTRLEVQVIHVQAWSDYRVTLAELESALGILP